MPEIEIRNIGDIPARTSVEFLFPELITGNTVIDVSEISKKYVCVDCGYNTTDVEEMLEHQDNQRKYHNIWQRLKRWWALL